MVELYSVTFFTIGKFFLFYLPLCRISRCSQRISPIKGGARLRNASRPNSQSSCPERAKFGMTTPSNENSRMAHANHCITWTSVHCIGSKEIERRKDICLFVCGVSLTSGQLIIELFPYCTRSCFSQVVLRHRGGDRIYEMRCLFVAVGPNARFIVLPHWDNMS